MNLTLDRSTVPTLEQLPAPPAGRSGWPWTEAPLTALEEGVWPSVTIVTASLNQSAFIEATLRSVLLQGYPNLEYIVMDGGSTDGTIELLRRYSPWLAHWTSEPDRGQSHAVNRGWARATGRIWAWLNSDDVYRPGAIVRAVRALRSAPEVDLVYGSAVFVDEEGGHRGPYPGRPVARGWRRLEFWKGWDVPQPTVFFRRELVDVLGGLDERLHYGMDYEWIQRVLARRRVQCLPDTLAEYRMHSGSKTGDWHSNKHLFFRELARVNHRFAPWWRPSSWPLWAAWLGFRVAEWRRRSSA